MYEVALIILILCSNPSPCFFSVRCNIRGSVSIEISGVFFAITRLIFRSNISHIKKTWSFSRCPGAWIVLVWKFQVSKFLMLGQMEPRALQRLGSQRENNASYLHLKTTVEAGFSQGFCKWGSLDAETHLVVKNTFLRPHASWKISKVMKNERFFSFTNFSLEEFNGAIPFNFKEWIHFEKCCNYTKSSMGMFISLTVFKSLIVMWSKTSGIFCWLYNYARINFDLLKKFFSLHA